MRTKLFSAALCACLAYAGLASAAQPQQSEVVQMITIKVKPGTNGALEEFVLAVKNAAQKNASKGSWLVAQSVSGEPTYTVYVPMGKWAELANPGAAGQLAKAYGEKEAKRLYGLFASSAESTSTAFYMTQPQLSIPRKKEGPPAAVVMFQLTLKDNMYSQWSEMSALSRQATMAKSPNAAYSVMRGDLGAPDNSILIAAFIDDWADMDQEGPGRAERIIAQFGQGPGSAILARGQETLAGIEQSLHRTRPDLAYQPAQ